MSQVHFSDFEADPGEIESKRALKQNKNKEKPLRVLLTKSHGIFHFFRLKKSVMFFIPSLHAAQGDWILVTTPTALFFFIGFSFSVDPQKLPSRSNKSHGPFEFVEINSFCIHNSRQVHENSKIHLLHTHT